MAVPRSQDVLGDEIGLPQLIPVMRNKSGGTACGNPEAQNKFLDFMPLNRAPITIAEDEVLLDEVAELVSTALNHYQKVPDDVECIDPYFTPLEWEKHYQQLRKAYDNVSEATLGSSVHHDDLVLAHDRIKNATCECKAHLAAREDEAMSQWISMMVDIPEPITDDWGHKLSQQLFPMILRAGNLPALVIEPCMQGTAHFILQLPSGESLHLTGWPDFTITRRYTPYAQRRIAASAVRKMRLKGIGEKQSPNQKSKTQAIAQAGMYGVGQLVTPGITKMTVIVLFKDKSAQVLIATSKPPLNAMPNSVGEVQYHYVERVDSMSLKDKTELQTFAKIMVSAFRYTMD